MSLFTRLLLLGASLLKVGRLCIVRKKTFFVSEVIRFYRLFFFPSHLFPMARPQFRYFSLAVSLVPLLPLLLFQSSMPPSALSSSCTFLTHISHPPVRRAVPCAMWQPWRVLWRPVPVWGGVDWCCVRPESVPSSLWGARPVPWRDMHLPARLGGGAL